MQTAEKTPESLSEFGKKAFANNDYKGAIEYFTQAIALKKTTESLCNRAAAYISLAKNAGSENEARDALFKAVDDADASIALKKTFLKAYQRKASAFFALKKFNDAKQAYEDGLDIDPVDKALHDGLDSITKQIAAMQAKKKKKNAKAEADAEPREVVLGIDLGTTYSCMSYWKDGGVVIIPNDHGEMTTPSYVSFLKNGKRIVGSGAKLEATRHPKNTVFDVKRFIGQTLGDSGVTDDIKRYPYSVVDREAGSNKPGVRVEVGPGAFKVFAPEEISAFVLAYLKKCAEKHLGVPIKKAVITVPAYFNDSQRAATKSAGQIAGLEVLRIINEPTAAALAYGLDKKSLNARNNIAIEETSGAEKVLIFDLGGGTFDVSVLQIERGVFEVKATGGDTRLGGEDIDHSVYEFLKEHLAAQGFDEEVVSEARNVKRIMGAIEKAKREISSIESTELVIEALIPREGTTAAKDFTYTLTRTEFNKIIKGLLTRTLETVKNVLKDAAMAPEEIDDIVLVGGSTRVPAIQAALSEFFGGKQLCKTLNPDEAVAYGAAVQGAILSGQRSSETRDLLLMDVTPLSLGIETVGRVMSVVIPRNTPIPCTRTEIYTTEENFQTSVDVSVYEGERAKTTDNHLLGEFNISGIEKAKRGEPKIDVQFEIDSNGILTVTAVDQKTGAKANIEIARGSRATEAEIAQMTADAEAYRQEDEQTSKVLEARNQLEQKLYGVQNIAQNIQGKSKAAHDLLVEKVQETMTWAQENEDTLTFDSLNAKMKDLDAYVKKARKMH
jgi:L1 cell adhesion molecule like protein